VAAIVHGPVATGHHAGVITRTGLAVIVAGGLVLDAYVHFDLASRYGPIKTTVLSQASLFRLEAVIAIIAAVAVLARPRRYTSAAAFAVAGSALAILLLYRYINIPAFGPIPSMYEPVWFTEKLVAFWAELVATIAAATLFVFIWVQGKQLEGGRRNG
jgi:hypothetical protein